MRVLLTALVRQDLATCCRLSSSRQRTPCPVDHRGSRAGVCFSHGHAGNSWFRKMGCGTVGCRPSANTRVDLRSVGLPGLVVCGDSDRDDVSYTFLQPFLSYTTKTSTSFTVNTESTYDGEHQHWTIPINFMVSQVLKVGGLPLSLQLGARYYAEAPAGGPNWGLRFTITPLFPTK